MDGSSVTFSELASTRMTCEEPVNALGASYLAALGAVEAGALTGSGLNLAGPDGELSYDSAG